MGGEFGNNLRNKYIKTKQIKKETIIYSRENIMLHRKVTYCPWFNHKWYLHNNNNVTLNINLIKITIQLY